MTSTLWGNILISVFVCVLFYFVGENLFRNRQPFIFYVAWVLTVVMIIRPDIIGKTLVSAGHFFIDLGIHN